MRLVVPRAEEVARELESTLSEAELLAVEKYLLEQGYVVTANIGLTWGTYTITPAGLEFLDVGASEPLEGPREEVTEKGPQGWIPRRFQLELIEARKQLEEERSEERGWWRRMFRG